MSLVEHIWWYLLDVTFRIREASTDIRYNACDGPAQKPTLAVDLWVYWLPLRMVHGKTKEKKNKTKHKQNKTTGATNKQSRHNKNT